MALIEKAKGRREGQSPSGYTRLFGIPALGNLISRIQGTSITAGHELEHLIWERVQKIDNLDVFIKQTMYHPKDGIWVARKDQIKKTIRSHYEPDFIAFELNEGRQQKKCYIIEVKDGDQFDTKKSNSEHITLHNFMNDIAHGIPFPTRVYICSFNASTKEEIYKGLKGKFSMDEILTGKELCDLFKIDYNEIVRARTNHHQSNLEYFVSALLRIDQIRTMILKRLNGFKNK